MEANAAYDALDYFASVANAPGGPSFGELAPAQYKATAQMKKAQGLAVVFPQCAEIDALCAATTGFFSEADYKSKLKSEALFGAVEGLRQRALVSADVLD